MVYIIGAAGLLLLIVAIVCVTVVQNMDRRLNVMNATETLSAREIGLLHRNREYGRRCEMVGVVECDAPISAPVSNMLCVAYSHQVARSIEEGSHTDGDDPFTPRNRQRTEVDAPEERRVRFYVRDGSGRVLIDPAWATMDMPHTKEEYNSTTYGVGSRTAETVGAWHTEHALAIGSQAYVLGYLSDFVGEPALGCLPGDTGQPFLISHRSEQELTRSVSGRSNLLYLVIGISSLLGIVFVGVAAYQLFW